MSWLYFFFTGITFLLLLLDAVIYPTFTLAHLYIDSVAVLLGYITFTLLIAGRWEDSFPKWLFTIHRKVIFPLLTCVSLALVILERLQYNNFVFSHLHIHPFIFMYLALLSGILVYAPHMRVEKEYKFLFFIPPIFLLTMYFISFLNEELFSIMIKEDNILEYLQFVFYFLASGYAFRLAYNQRKHKRFLVFVFLLVGIALFFVAGEEISWGQRILGIHTPVELKNVNAQDEITIHNLDPLQMLLPIGFILVGLYGALSRFIAQKLLKKNNILILFTPPIFLFLPFFIVALFYYQNTFGLYTYAGLAISNYRYPQNWQEVIEVFLAFGFFGYTYSSFKNLSTKPKKSK